MTVNELIKKLQNLPEDHKNLKIKQLNHEFNDFVDIHEIKFYDKHSGYWDWDRSGEEFIGIE